MSVREVLASVQLGSVRAITNTGTVSVAADRKFIPSGGIEHAQNSIQQFGDIGEKFMNIEKEFNNRI